MMMTPDVNVFIVDFPSRGNEMVAENEDGSYTILINARLSNAGQLKAYEHAIKHIANNDFERYDAQQIELVAHAKATPQKKEHQIDGIDASLWFTQQLQRHKKERKKIQRKLKRVTARNEYLFKHQPALYEEMIFAQRDAQLLKRYYGED